MVRKSSKRNQWEDHYARQAKKEKYPARSVYKLKEIQKKYWLIQKGFRVLDLGCSPGSWLIYAAEMTGERGRVVGIDLKPVTLRLPSHVRVHVGDALDPREALLCKLGKQFHVVISDMAPSTTGNKHVDAARSFRLCEAALSIAEDVLAPGGSFVCKIFQGEFFKDFSDKVKKRFEQHKIYKPKSSRKASKEIFVIGIGKK